VLPPKPQLVRCFLCNALVDRSSDSPAAEIGLPLAEAELHFWAHIECMKAVASPDFRFPSAKDIDEHRRWLEEEDEQGDDASGEEDD
jgi:hypothetical protein